MSALSDFLGSSSEQFPLGTLLSSLADVSQLPSGWVALDGSLLPRAGYPDAADMLGDVRMCDATESSIGAVSPLGDWTINGAELNGIARESVVLLACQANNATAQGQVFVRRSIDGGASFHAITWPISNVINFLCELHWLGGMRAMAIFRIFGTGDSQRRWYVSCTANIGADDSWTPPVQLIGAFSEQASDRSVATDTTVAIDGTGHAYIALRDAAGSGGRIFAVHVVTGQVASFAVASDGANPSLPRVIVGRPLGDGSSELLHTHKAAGVLTSYLTTINAQTGSVSHGGSGTPGYGDIDGQASGRFWSIRGGPGREYVATSSGSVYKLGLISTIMPTLVFSGFADAGRRMLDNMLISANGIRYDVLTGVETRSPNVRAGVHFGVGSDTYVAVSAWDVRPSAGRFLAGYSTGYLCMRSARVVNGFFTGASQVIDAARWARELSSAVGWYNADTGVYRAAKMASGNSVLLIYTYGPKDDYGQYLQLPYMPGVICRVK